MSAKTTCWSFTAFMVLLCLSRALGRCNWSLTMFNTVLVCTNNTDINNLILKPFNTFDLELHKMYDVKDTVKKLITHNITGNMLRTLTITNSNLLEIPNELLNLPGLKKANVHGNNIKSINLNNLVYAKHLSALNVSDNGIEEFEGGNNSYKSTTHLETLNLSRNRLRQIPTNCFFGLRDSLTTLLLSYNQISFIDSNSFSGLVNLDRLDLSNNQIENLGLFLYPIRSLKTLDLASNAIQRIINGNFKKSCLLVNLDLSDNRIECIENHAFDNLNQLENLNLIHNRIQSVQEVLFKNNTNLKKLSLEAAQLSTNIFLGLNTTSLNLSNTTIIDVEGTLFLNMGNNINYLNLSLCKIQHISDTAFDTLTELKELDLSNNKLSEVNFLKVHLGLLKLYLQNNSIQDLKSDTFEKLSTLTLLDLSNNYIKNIPSMIFKNLSNLVTLKIVNNQLDNNLFANTFFGLEKLQYLDLTYTKVIQWDDYSLSGLNNLIFLNGSHGELVFIEKYAFIALKKLEILDLSYNQLRDFNIKLSHNTNMRKIFLNNNHLKVVSKTYFDDFGALEILNLAGNNIFSVDTSAFISLRALKHLDLSHNPNINLTNNVFDNLVLDTLLLKNVGDQAKFLFNNVTISNLDMSSNKLSKLNIGLQNIKNLLSLDLSQNNISSLNTFSFLSGFESLKLLNLSHNNICNVEPGTFLNSSIISELDLSYNNIHRIKFGALHGLCNLKKLNLANNNLTEFKLALLNDVQSVSTIILDNNMLEDLFIADNVYDLKRLSIGGNYNIPCERLLYLQTRHKVNLMARSLDYFSENVFGIPCSPYIVSQGKVEDDITHIETVLIK